MQSELIAVYNEQYKKYAHNAEEAHAILEKSIHGLDLEGRIRGDARVFLLLNMEHLVLRPFRQAYPDVDVTSILENDIPQILRSARETAEEAGRDWIKGRDVVEGTLATWDNVLMHIDPVPEA